MYAYMHIYTIHTCHVWHHRIHMNWINTNLYLSSLLHLTTLSLSLSIYTVYIYYIYIWLTSPHPLLRRCTPSVPLPLESSLLIEGAPAAPAPAPAMAPLAAPPASAETGTQVAQAEGSLAKGCRLGLWGILGPWNLEENEESGENWLECLENDIEWGRILYLYQHLEVHRQAKSASLWT